MFQVYIICYICIYDLVIHIHDSQFPEGAQEYNRSQVWYYPSTPVARVYGKVYNCNTIIKSVQQVYTPLGHLMIFGKKN